MSALQDGQSKLGACITAQDQLAVHIERTVESQTLSSAKRGKLNAAQTKLNAMREASAMALADCRATLATLAAARSFEAASKAEVVRLRRAVASLKAKCPEPLGF